MHDGCFRRLPRLNRSMNCGLSLKLKGKLRETLEKILGRGLLTQLFAKQEFAVNKVKGFFQGRQAGMDLQINFGRHALALLPALPLIDAQNADDLDR